MRRRLLVTALGLATACAVACGRSGIDYLDGATTVTPTPTASPTATVPCDPCLPSPGDLVVSEVFMRDFPGSDDTDANLSTFSSGPDGDDRFVEIVNVSTRRIDLGGTEVRLAIDADDPPFVWHSFLFPEVLLPGHARVVFNNRGGVDLGPLRALVGTSAVIELANADGDLSMPGNPGDLGLRVELTGLDQELLFYLIVDLDADERMQVTRGLEPDPVSAVSDVIPVDPDPCSFLGCGGIYSIAVDADSTWSLARGYTEHRRIRTEDACDRTDADFPCCAFSPGRRAVDDGGAYRECARY